MIILVAQREPGDDHRGFANTTDRWLCNCEQNRQLSTSVAGSKPQPQSLKQSAGQLSPYIGIVFAAHNDEDFDAMSLVAARRPPRSNANVDPLFLFSLEPADETHRAGSANFSAAEKRRHRRCGRFRARSRLRETTTAGAARTNVCPRGALNKEMSMSSDLSDVYHNHASRNAFSSAGPTTRGNPPLSRTRR